MYRCKECTLLRVKKDGEICEECLANMPKAGIISGQPFTITGGAGGAPVTITTTNTTGETGWVWISVGGQLEGPAAASTPTGATGQIDLYLQDKVDKQSIFRDLGCHHPGCSNVNVIGAPRDDLGRSLVPLLEVVECGCTASVR